MTGAPQQSEDLTVQYVTLDQQQTLSFPRGAALGAFVVCIHKAKDKKAERRDRVKRGMER